MVVRLSTVFLAKRLTDNKPVEDCALCVRFGEFLFESTVLFPFLKMSVERNDYHAPTLEERHIGNNGKVVRVDIHLELRLEIKGVFVKETSVHSIVACHTFDLCRVQKQATARLGNVGKTDTCKSCDVLAWSLAVRIVHLRSLA